VVVVIAIAVVAVVVAGEEEEEGEEEEVWVDTLTTEDIVAVAVAVEAATVVAIVEGTTAGDADIGIEGSGRGGDLVCCCMDMICIDRLLFSISNRCRSCL
jgi:hypothetical protein